MNKNLAIKLFVIVLLSSVVLSACGTGFAFQATNTPKVIRIATDATYPPFETVDENSKEMVGFDMDLINAVMKEAGVTNYEIVNSNFDSLLTGVVQCQYDAAISAITITEDRAKQMNFSDGYINAGQIVTVNSQTTDITGPVDLKGRTIGVQIATTGAIESEKLGASEVKTYDTIDLAFQDLINRQVDAVVADYPTSLAFVEVNQGKINVVGQAFTEEVYGIAVCKTNTELLATINKGLAAVTAKGVIKELEQKWLAGE